MSPPSKTDSSQPIPVIPPITVPKDLPKKVKRDSTALDRKLDKHKKYKKYERYKKQKSEAQSKEDKNSVKKVPNDNGKAANVDEFINDVFKSYQESLLSEALQKAGSVAAAASILAIGAKALASFGFGIRKIPLKALSTSSLKIKSISKLLGVEGLKRLLFDQAPTLLNQMPERIADGLEMQFGPAPDWLLGIGDLLEIK